VRILSSIVFAGCLFGSFSPALAADKVSQVFVRDAIQRNLAEIQLGQLAKDKAQSADVKSLGETLVNEQTELNEPAKQAASQIGITIPTEQSISQKATYDAMSKLSGAAFDRAFIKNMVTTTAAIVARFENEAKKKNDPAADYARQALPTLRKHLEAAQKLSHGM
jgi:putative membrane protein